MEFKLREVKQISKAWILLSIAFSFLFIGGIYGLNSGLPSILIYFAVSFLTVGFAFVLHELSHKFMAQKYGFSAEFEAFDKMLFLAIAMSLFGFIIAAPGAVMIRSRSGIFNTGISKKQNGKISLAGPGTNIILAIIFLILIILLHNLSLGLFLNLILSVGFTVNSLLAFFNLLPFYGFDGKKILDWNPQIYGFSIGLSIILLILRFTYL